MIFLFAGVVNKDKKREAFHVLVRMEKYVPFETNTQTYLSFLKSIRSCYGFCGGLAPLRSAA
jgi:hypothetical protein